MKSPLKNFAISCCSLLFLELFIFAAVMLDFPVNFLTCYQKLAGDPAVIE